MPLLADSIVPFGADGHVDLGAARAHALWLREHGIDGVALGAEEILHVDRREKERLIEVVADALRGLRVLVPIWETTPAYALKLARLAADRGATALLLPPPLFVPCGEQPLFEWFRSVAQAAPLPVLAWHDPRFGNPLGPSLLARLRAETPIAGWLDASGDAHRIRRLAEAWPGRGWATIDGGLAPPEVTLLAATTALAGGVSRLANAWPDLARRAWVVREPGGADVLARRALSVERAGGVAALKHTLGVGARIPLAGLDLTEVARLPPSGFR